LGVRIRADRRTPVAFPSFLVRVIFGFGHPWKPTGSARAGTGYQALRKFRPFTGRSGA
jgi:hypothetical protein